ncbi:unnamed protein product [Rotaria sordida]|uniref:EGF-like domain-containing protein n=1 Tax=Rotaria sordida TaxID=392033 RepID=A0A815ECI9_9BILA|nr:unnamed protein product [Rotaria sordida]CAF3886440.1 unnamed protein product [Rotaria sordida]
MNVTQDEVLAWSSGIEMVDRYAAYLTTELVKRLIYCLPGEQQCIDRTDKDRCEELELNECEENEYRCQDGLCIGEQYWLDGEYDCLDQTDEQEGHNDFSATAWCPLVSSQFSCDEINRESPLFTTFCKHPKEYGCILANMNESINFHVHRPCINVTQIGDGIIDCYGGLDEPLLLSDDSVIDYYIFHVPLILSKNLNKKFRFNLIHSRPKILSESYTVRFEAYHLSVDSSIKFISVWEYPIHFPFLPSYRLAQVLQFENDQIISSKPHICHIANPCRHESTCHPVMNKLNNMSTYYCRCNTNSFGKQCEELLAPSSSSICSKHALLYLLSPSKSICLCPTYRYGPTCSINHTCVYKNPCGVNRGKCYNNPDNLTRDYICVCDKKFFGDHCEFDSAVIRINFTDFVFVQSPSNFIMSSIIQLCDLHNKTFDLIV